MRIDGWRRMGSDDDFPIRQGLPVELGFSPGLAGLSFPLKISCIIVYTIYLYELTPPYMSPERLVWVDSFG